MSKFLKTQRTLKTIFLEILNMPITKLCFKITHLNLQPHLLVLGFNELTSFQ